MIERAAGYDPELAGQLDSRQQLWLKAQGILALLGPFLLGMGVAAFAEGLAQGAALGLGCWALTWNLTRLLHAGSGMHPAAAEAQRLAWCPTLWGPAILLLWSAVLSQPGVLFLAGTDHNLPVIETWRLVWDNPAVAGALTLCLALLGAAATVLRTLAPGAVKAYEGLRVRRDRKLALVTSMDADRWIEAHLAKNYPDTFSGKLFRGFRDPPFNTVRRGPPYLDDDVEFGDSSGLFEALKE